MYAGTPPSWSVTESDGSPLVTHLIVRELLGTVGLDGLDLPVTGAVSPIEGIPERLLLSLAEEWALWWQHSLVRHGGAFWAPTDDPLDTSWPRTGELRAFIAPRRSLIIEVASQVNVDARRALHGRTDHDPLITNAMMRIVAERRRRAKPFRLSVELLAVPRQDGAEVARLWRVSPDRVIATTTLFAERTAYMDALEPVLRDLA